MNIEYFNPSLSENLVSLAMTLLGQTEPQKKKISF